MSRQSFVPAPPLGESIDAAWRTWGPYLSERQWGTVREDYSETGEAWDFFPHDHARSRVYRWGEDGILGISDDRQLLCFAIALWNGNDPILKERLFGLTGSEGNHGEDVKEYYYYQDGTPTHSYLKGLYKYPHRAYPYQDLVQSNSSRSRHDPEYELIDTGIFDDDRYFDVQVEYAKVGFEDLLVRVSITNWGPDPAYLDLLPTLWFRNTWSWGRDERLPRLSQTQAGVVQASHPELGDYWLSAEGEPELLFTGNETNTDRLWGVENRSPFVKDGINTAVVGHRPEAVNPDKSGTKVAARYSMSIAPGETRSIRLRLARQELEQPFADADKQLAIRIEEADKLYSDLAKSKLVPELVMVQRQALAGLIWSKQYYEFAVDEWIDGDPSGPPPPASRRSGRNSRWRHHRSHDVISMPDKWEYPWYAAWDLAFHTIAFALVDRQFAREQLLLLASDRFMHPNGQLPAYEWAFSDVNPPVHLLAARMIVGMDDGDLDPNRDFLTRLFNKLAVNFTWWVNRKDAEGNNVFEGGFLGLDNISVIDRSMALPEGVTLEQSDGTAWMATYCLAMTWAALALGEEDPVFADMALKFFRHYLSIGAAINGFAPDQPGLWDEQDGFYYDVLRRSDGAHLPLKVRSLVGLMPMVPAIAVEPSARERLLRSVPQVLAEVAEQERLNPELVSLFPTGQNPGAVADRLFTLVPEDRLRRLLARMLDPNEFLSDYGIRSISRHHLENPYQLDIRGQQLSVSYEPSESSTGMFGGNSNWRGPIWMPANFLLVRGLRNLYRFYGDAFQVEYPTGSGNLANLDQIADDLTKRLIAIFLPDSEGRRPVFGGTEKMQSDPRWHDNILFYEYFHGDNGAGIGASHQTGWTALVANLIADLADET